MELYILIALCGVFAGFISTLAGLGSVLTLYLLIDVVGLEDTIANETNRLGVMAMTIMALPTFYKKGHLDIDRSWRIALVLCIGAIGGFWLALDVKNGVLREVFKYLLLLMLALVLSNPQKWTQKTDPTYVMNSWISFPVFLLMGFYAGFIQIGAGIFFVVFLTMVGKYSLIDANGIKLFAFALYTIIGIMIFALNDKINWSIELSLALGQGLGAYFTARFVTTYPKANVFVRYLLILLLLVAIVRMFELYKYLL